MSEVREIMERMFCSGDTRPYVFVRADCFYVIELRDDDDARRNAEWNPGTIRVENVCGETVWCLQ